MKIISFTFFFAFLNKMTLKVMTLSKPEMMERKIELVTVFRDNEPVI